MIFSSIEVHDKEITGFDLVEMVELDQSLDVGDDYLLWGFGIDVDKTRDKSAEVVCVERVSFDKIVHYFEGIVSLVEMSDGFEEVRKIVV